VGLRALATDFWVSRALHVAVKLGLPDLLADGPKNIDALAAQIGANDDALFRLMRVEQNEKQFALTGWAEMLGGAR
jgi:hypothetical protein